MKTFNVLTVVAAVVLPLGLAIALSSVSYAEPSYEWKIAAPVGSGCFPPKCEPGKFPMAIVPLAGFDGKLFSIGDRAIWVSSDGITWDSKPKIDWGERHGMQYAFFRGRLWMLGGMRTWDDFRNDVWSSENGTEWKQVVENSPWSKRRWHNVFVFEDRLWLIGGASSSGRPDQTPTEFLNDVWSSDDGIAWRLETNKTPWDAKSGVSVVVFRGQIYAVSGAGQVWSSGNGKEWREIVRTSPSGVRGGSGVLAFDQRIWVLGGADRNDVWSSADGRAWKKEFSAAPWSKRNTSYSVVFKEKLWLYSGKTGREDSWDGAVWTMSRRAE